MTHRLRVYVAGPYSADNVLDVLRNIGRAIEVGTSLFMAGYAPFCPHLDHHYAMTLDKDAMSVEDYYAYSMAWLEVSDVVALLPGWEKSKGCQMEVARAKELGIPVMPIDLVPTLPSKKEDPCLP